MPPRPSSAKMRQRSWRILPITPTKFYHPSPMFRAVGDNDVMRWAAALAGVALCMLGSGCFESKLRECANGGICPESLACTEETPVECGEPADVEACRSISKGN